ncbi:MAG: electron transfer flavoprotein subunit beta/FixA family protein [Anaerolineales bacterium]|nr:electron transfer flavoprotein subunit beta/FixA family protein [Anaerolineales bacterium]
MKIVVCVKQVPDSAATVTVENGQVVWGDAPLVINPWDEYAVEAALKLTEEHGGDVVALSMGGEDEKEAVKHALAMGSSEAILVSDPALKGIDAGGTAKVLAAAVQKIGDADMVIFGRQSIDSDSGLMASQVARILGWPSLTLVAAIDALNVDDKQTRVERNTEEGRQVIESRLPAVLSITKDFGEPRYPSFMGIRKASRAEVPVWSVAELGIAAPEAVISWPEVMNPPTREVTTEIISGGSPQEIAETLAEKIIAEKVL